MLYLLCILGCGLLLSTIVYILGRSLKVEEGDPTLPEKMLTYQIRLALLITISLCCAPLLTGFLEIFVAPPMDLPTDLNAFLICVALFFVVAILSANYYQTRHVLHQTWSLYEYLSYNIRQFIGISGFWILLMLTPFVVEEAASLHWIVGTGLFVILNLWSHFFSLVIPPILKNSQPISADLSTSLKDIIEKATVPRPAIFAIHPEQSNWHNAFAIPSQNNPLVLISRPVLKNFTLEEIRAVFAHEMAHLEDFSATFIRKHQWFERLFIAAAGLGYPALIGSLPSMPSWFPFMWIILVGAYLGHRNKDLQKRERFADRRALDLCQNHQALISALIKLHTANLVPRRWKLEFEINATHPSPASRIRQIKQISENHVDGHTAPEADVPGLEPNWTLIVPAESEHKEHQLIHIDEKRISILTFDPTFSMPKAAIVSWNQDLLLHQRDQSLQSRSLTYNQLIDLRVTLKRKRKYLKIKNKTGNSSLIPLKENDIRQIQNILDHVDFKIPKSATPYKGWGNPLLRYLCFASGLIGFLYFSDSFVENFSGIIVIALAVFVYKRKSTAFLASLGGACMGMFLFYGVPIYNLDQILTEKSILLALMGGIGVYIYFSTHHLIRLNSGNDRSGIAPQKNAGYFLAAGLILFCFHLLNLFNGRPLLTSYFIAQNTSFAFLLMFTAGAAYSVSNSKAVRLSGIVIMVMGSAQPVLRSDYYLTHVAEDYWAGKKDMIHFDPKPYTPIHQATINGNIYNLSVSEHGRYYQYRGGDNDVNSDGDETGYNQANVYTVRDFSYTQQAYQCNASQFAGDEYLLMAKKKPGGFNIEYVHVGNIDSPIWEKKLTHTDPAKHYYLSVGNRNWRLTPQIDYTHLKNFEVYDGTLLEDSVRIRHWNLDQQVPYIRTIADGPFLLSAMNFEPVSFERLDKWEDWDLIESFLNRPYYFQEWVLITDKNIKKIGVSGFTAQTVMPPPGYEDILIASHAKDYTYLWLINTGSGERRCVGTIKKGYDIHFNGQWVAICQKNELLFINPYTNQTDSVDITPALASESAYPTIAMGKDVVCFSVRERKANRFVNKVVLLKIPEG